MTPDETDEYISFCSRILGGKEDETAAEYFGKAASKKMSGEDMGENGEKGGRTRVMEGEGLRPGEEYKIWNSRDVDGEAPLSIERVIGRASLLGGVRVEYLGGVIESFERRLARIK